jgi:hypothetical protein
MTGEELCPVEHLGLVISGRTAVLMEDRTEMVTPVAVVVRWRDISEPPWSGAVRTKRILPCSTTREARSRTPVSSPAWAVSRKAERMGEEVGGLDGVGCRPRLSCL